MSKRYFTDFDHDKLIYFQMPKVLMYGEKYEKLSNDAKILYMICFDLLKVSMENHGRYNKHGQRQCWKDENGYYIKLSNDKLKKIMKCGKTKAVKLKQELEKHDLLEQKRVGLNQANLLYVLQLNYSEDDIYVVNEIHEELLVDPVEDQKEEAKSVGGQRKFKKRTSGSSENELQEVQKSDPINNKYNNNKSIEIEEEEINNARARGENTYHNLSNELNLTNISNRLVALTEHLLEKGCSKKQIKAIVSLLHNKGIKTFTIREVDSQLAYMNEGMANESLEFHSEEGFAKFFGNGLENLMIQNKIVKEHERALLIQQEMEEQQRKERASQNKHKYYNWLNEESTN